MGRTRCARMLLAAGAFAKPRTAAGCDPLMQISCAPASGLATQTNKE
jgi:hypothetical protein